jgi:5,10-methylenetetrahydrofolate reductase
LTRLSDILTLKRRVVSTEFLPPRSPDINHLLQVVMKVADRVDCVSIPEIKANYNNVPRHRMNPFHVALRIHELTGVETLFHLTPRDYNKNAIAGTLLAAAQSKMHNILVIGGDRYTYRETINVAKNVYDFANSIDMIKGIRNFEDEFDLNGSQKFFVAAGTDPSILYSKDKIRLEKEMGRLLGRQDAGANAIQTQPVFDLRCLEFIDIAREHGIRIPFMVGLLPLRSEADADYIGRRFVITIPPDYKTSIKTPSDGVRKPCELAVQLLTNGVTCLHLYPREDPNFVLQVTEAIRSSSRSNELQ